MRITVKGLAKFIQAPVHRRIQIVKEFQEKDTTDGAFKAAYYSSARAAVARFHREGHDLNSLRNKSAELKAEAVNSRSARANRLLNNARGIESYGTNFGNLRFEVVPREKLLFVLSGVTISATPDLHVVRDSKTALVKLDFSKNIPKQEMIDIVLYTTIWAAESARLKVNHQDVLYLDVERGTIFAWQSNSRRVSAIVRGACEEVARISSALN
jgi:hypothetical protein